MTPKEINSKLVIPSSDSASPVKTEEAAFIYNFIKERELKKTLEVGFAYAKSASHIIAATESAHIACDPFQDHYQNLGLENIKTLGLDGLLDFRNDFSHNVLPELLKQEKLFEFIFIDGDHKFDGELIDFYYADLLLEENGFVLLHDTWMRSTALVSAFIKTNRKNYKEIPTGLRNLALYQKVGKDERDGMHFKEFYTLKSILSHYGILYMSSGETNWLKRTLMKIKDWIK